MLVMHYQEGCGGSKVLVIYICGSAFKQEWLVHSRIDHTNVYGSREWMF